MRTKQACKQGGPYLNSSNTKPSPSAPRPHRILSIASCTSAQGKWLNTWEWWRTRTSLNHRHSIRVRRKYCRQCSCEVLLGWLGSAQFCLMSDWVVIDGCNVSKVPELRQNIIQALCFFSASYWPRKCFRICFDNITLCVLSLHPRRSCIKVWMMRSCQTTYLFACECYQANGWCTTFLHI